MADNVNHPNHYQLKNGMEVWDVIDACTDLKAFCKGNIIKYVMRADKKNGKEDLLKARNYIDKLIECLDREEKEGGKRNELGNAANTRKTW